jgi:hypothetical protein
MSRDEAITAAAKRLQTAVVQLENIEALFFENKVRPDVLRAAWMERDQARRALRAAHVGAERA